ncbi:KaiC/GvpD/RAD55 family RecA-like ATPase [Methanohalophilus levihalophilus]|uniref:RAD55 family ATPase n=1 Tax=Methanohalophilus levihalophilus TaxID=1431282 RepID=UPI001AE59F48|nr:ATPase domain-containing protein [Methanohalophilus levihalophilus]MBP2029553.1 KaiC/GvpD/RAD55 family RecA-like ATPase [Methanohalophilus levihalophilus]
MERISTGIEALDREIEGGLPKNKGFLVTGTAGSGKTIFGMHVISRACEDGKKCLMLATEETSADIVAEAEIFGFDFSRYMEEETLTIKKILEIRSKTTTAASNLISGLSVSEIDIMGISDLVPDNIDVLVIDNIGVFALGMTPRDFRNQFDTLNLILAEKKITVIYVLDMAANEMTQHVADYSTYGSFHFLVKENPYTSKMERFIFIPKMRGTNIPLDLSKFVINSEGICVLGSGE